MAGGCNIILLFTHFTGTMSKNQYFPPIRDFSNNKKLIFEREHSGDKWNEKTQLNVRTVLQAK